MDPNEEVPAPPSLTPADDAEYRRPELQAELEAGAWEDAFEQWRETTAIEDDAYAIALDLELFGEFDFFWDEIAQRVGFHAPGIPDDWDQTTYHDELSSWRQTSSINASLAEFGQIVCDVLESEYIDWAEDDWGDDLDLPSYD